MRLTIDKTILVLLFVIIMENSIGISLILFNLYTYTWVTDKQGKKVIAQILGDLNHGSTTAARLSKQNTHTLNIIYNDLHNISNITKQNSHILKENMENVTNK